MRFENQSKFYPDEHMIPMIEFVEARNSLTDLATLIVVDTDEPHMQTSGYAWKNRPDVGPLSLVAPALIKLKVSRCLTFPQRSGHAFPAVTDKCGFVVFKTWEEEFLFVLSHESQHISSMYSGTYIDELEGEIDAEKCAIWMLKAWRKAQKQ